MLCNALQQATVFNKTSLKSTVHYLLSTKPADIVEHFAAKKLDISLKSW